MGRHTAPDDEEPVTDLIPVQRRTVSHDDFPLPGWMKYPLIALAVFFAALGFWVLGAYIF